MQKLNGSSCDCVQDFVKDWLLQDANISDIRWKMATKLHHVWTATETNIKQRLLQTSAGKWKIGIKVVEHKTAMPLTEPHKKYLSEHLYSISNLTNEVNVGYNKNSIVDM